MTAQNLNCLTCKMSNFLPDDIQGVLNLGTVTNFLTNYLVTISDRNGNNVFKSTETSGALGELSITFTADDSGKFHHYFACGFPLTVRNLTTGEIEEITSTNGIASDCIELMFDPCNTDTSPYDLVLFEPKTCNCEAGCNCP